MKGLILAAGYGSRFFPASKTIPKEMFPLVDRPSIDFIVEEMVLSGINQILIITSRRKKSLEDYFDSEVELENFIHDKKKLEKIKSIPQVNQNVKIYFLRQHTMRGTGHGVLLGNDFLDSPFILAFPDDIIFNEIPLSQQLIDVYNKNKKSVLAVTQYPSEELYKYGVINPFSKVSSKIIDVKGIVEKPKKGEEPSNYISIGRYLLTPEIFPLLEKGIKNCTSKEYFLTDALNELAQNEKLLAYDFDGARFDTGDPIGYLRAITSFALSRDDLKTQYRDYLKEII